MSKLLNKVFKSKGTKVQIPDEAKSKPTPRSRDEINQTYQQLCVTLGDKTVKKEGIEQDIKNLFRHLEALGNELSARDELDKASSDSAKGADGPLTSSGLVTEAQDAKA